MAATSIAVELRDGRHRAVLRPGLLRPVRMGGEAHGCTVGLVATGALLLGGDHVQICVEVGAGAHLDLRDIAGTVAFDGRGARCRWDVRVVVGPGGVLRWSGEPFVVAEGADVARSLRIEAASSAQVSIRETLVLGRSGETGGRLSNRSEAVVGGSTVYYEDLDLLDPVHRSAAGRRPGGGQCAPARSVPSDPLALSWRHCVREPARGRPGRTDALRHVRVDERGGESYPVPRR